MRTLPLSSATTALLLALVGCGGGGHVQPSEHVATSKPSTRPADPTSRPTNAVAAVRVMRTAYGAALADRRGFALYLFTHDRSPASTCYGPCAAAWPPYLVTRRPPAVAPGAHAAALGTSVRADGRLQVTYAGHPLYYYVDDRRPGEVLCQGVEQFGGTWEVVAPDGHAIH